MQKDMKDHLKLCFVIVGLILILLIFGLMTGGCQRQAGKVSHNLSLEADNFNVTRRITVVNTRAEDPELAILFQMTGNFSIDKESDGDLAVIGENPDGTYYKHFVMLSRDISYICQDLGATSVSKHKFEINYNPRMLIPVEIVTVD